MSAQKTTLFHTLSIGQEVDSEPAIKGANPCSPDCLVNLFLNKTSNGSSRRNDPMLVPQKNEFVSSVSEEQGSARN